MRVPPNYGRAYSQQFESVYPQLAKANGAVLVPFLLEGVGGVRALNQADGVHPTAEGQRKMAETVWRVLEPVLRQGERRQGEAGEKVS
jgi:acyl-CoA thioesterase-1